MREFEEALEGRALLKIGPSGPENCKLIFTKKPHKIKKS